MTEDEARAFIKRLREIATEVSDAGNASLAADIRSFAEQMERDVNSGVFR
jgi:hypothetical protein